MRLSILVSAAIPLIAAMAPGAARAQVFATSVTASVPDPNGKVPAFNVVPGAGIATWSDGLAQAVLTAGQSYEYCVSLGSGTATGKATVSYKISRGSAVIQSAVIIPASKFSISSNGVWYLCAGYHQLPSSPGAATLSGIVAFTASGATKAKVSKVTASILLQ